MPASDTSFIVLIDAPMVFDCGDVCEPPVAQAPQPDPWRCPTCGGDVITKDKRNREGFIRRRRECLRCGHRYTTHEVIV